VDTRQQTTTLVGLTGEQTRLQGSNRWFYITIGAEIKPEARQEQF
jgi:hypothetical protein